VRLFGFAPALPGSVWRPLNVRVHDETLAPVARLADRFQCLCRTSFRAEAVTAGLKTILPGVRSSLA
jgi:hypothetical protein